MSPGTKGVVVVLAGFGLTIALGSLFVLALIAGEMLRPLSAGGTHGWTVRQLSLPFAVAAASFVLAMFAGGSVQDRVGPRWPSTAGGVLIGLGLILASMSEAGVDGSRSSMAFMILGLGFMVGTGAGLTFASVVPPAVKWTVPRHRGLVVGLVTAGIASGPAWLNGSVEALVRERGISSILLVQGISLLGLIVILSQLIEDPLVGYVPPGSYADAKGLSDTRLPWVGLSPRQTLKTPTYRALWGSVCALAVATAFLSALLSVPPSANAPRGMMLGLGVALLSCLGGVVAGLIYDRVGRFGLSAVFVLLTVTLGGGALLAANGWVTAAALLAAAVWAAALVAAWVSTMECFGTRNAGANFGLVFTGWGVGLLVGAAIATSAVGSGSSGRENMAVRVAMAAGFVLVLAMVQFLALRVQPPSLAGGAADASPGQRRGFRG